MDGAAYTRRHNDTHDRERPPITDTTRLHPGTIVRHTAASRTGLLDASSREGENIDTIYLDFAKAFDTVPHQRLLMKLRGYGIEGRILTRIEAFLTDRRQRVVVNDSRSSWADVTSGIPQGSVLGPMLFIIYINDMPTSVLSSIYLFADDAKVYRNISSNDDTPTPQHDLQQLEKWSERWQLRFNSNKCKVMHLGRQNPRQN